MNYTHITSFLTTFTANEMEKIIIWGSRKNIFICVRIERSQNSVNIYDFQSCRDAWPRLGFSITITPTLLLKEIQNWLKKYWSSPQMKLFVAVLSAL